MLESLSQQEVRALLAIAVAFVGLYLGLMAFYWTDRKWRYLSNAKYPEIYALTGALIVVALGIIKPDMSWYLVLLCAFIFALPALIAYRMIRDRVKSKKA